MALSGNRQGGSPRARIVTFMTSTDRGPLFDGDEGEFVTGHSHTWRNGDARTSADAGHSHRVTLGRVQKNPNDGHAHTIGEAIPELENVRSDGVPSMFARRGGRRDAE